MTGAAGAPATERCRAPACTAHPPYTRRAMNVTATPVPKSSILLEIEVPSERLDRAIREAAGRLSRRTRVAGFRPGKAPRPILERVLGPTAVVDEAVEQLVQASYREAVIEQGLVPLTNADVEIVEAAEGKALRYKATIQVRPEVALGDYAAFGFAPEIETIDAPKVDKVVEELRDQNATLAAVEDRAAKEGDWAVIGFAGTVRRRHVRTDAVDHRRGPPDPGLRGQPRGPHTRRVHGL